MHFYVKDKKLILNSIAIVALLTLAITLVFNTFLMNDVVERKSQNYYHTYIENQYISIIDTYDSEKSTFTRAMKEDGFLTRLKRFNHELRIADDLNYFEISEQQVESWDHYDGKDIFVVAYDRDPSMKNQLIKTPAGQVYVTPLYSIQIDSRAYDYFLKNHLAIGKSFVNDDYYFQPDKTAIPCILGSDYSTVYNIGDTMRVVYLFKEINLKVIGFFDKTASIPINGSILYLDYYIVMPSLICNYNPTNSEDEFFQIILYDQKNSGYLVDKGLDYYALVRKIAKAHNLQYTVGTDNKDISMINQGLTALLTKKVVIMISILLMLMVISSLIFITMVLNML